MLNNIEYAIIYVYLHIKMYNSAVLVYSCDRATLTTVNFHHSPALCPR